MDIILKEELLRSVGLFPFIFAGIGWWYFHTNQSYPIYLNVIIPLAITILTIPLRVWYRRRKLREE
jgi:membrane protein YdbS with pleckstrin-like domain